MSSKKSKRLQRTRKAVFVGTLGSGMRTLIIAMDEGHCCEETDRYRLDVPVVNVPINGKTISLGIWSTRGQEDYDRLRPLSYPGTNVVLICYNVDNPLSAVHVIEKWAPEIRSFCDECPVILVACKIDLRTDPQTLTRLRKTGEKPLTHKMGRKLANAINADAYIECSSKTGEGIQDLLNETARLSIRRSSFHRPPITCKCILQ